MPFLGIVDKAFPQEVVAYTTITKSWLTPEIVKEGERKLRCFINNTKYLMAVICLMIIRTD